MFENLKKITIKGGPFECATEIDVFKQDAINVIYGRNGSGKTTIAHGIGELIKPIEERSPDFTITSDSPIPNEKNNSVFIFDEDFIREQVRVEKDGINTIVMLGEQVELDNQIEIQKKKLQQKIEEYNYIQKERELYDDHKDNHSPLYFTDQIKNALRENDGWAEIDRSLKGNVVKSHITDDVVKTLLELPEPTETYDQLRSAVFSDLKLYCESKDASSIDWSKPTILLPKELSSLSMLLQKPLDAPVLSEREQRLVNLLNSHPNHSTEETKILLNEKWTFCPTCLREITENDRDEISTTLTKILNKKSDEYVALLQVELDRFAPLRIDMPMFGGGLNEYEVNAAQQSIIQLNIILEKVRDRIEQRRKQLYESIACPFSEAFMNEYQKANAELNKSIDSLEKCVERFNDSILKRTKLYSKIRDANNRLAQKQLSALLSSYKKAESNSALNAQSLKDKHNECEEISEKIQALKAQKERTDIALDYINNELQFVFYSRRRMSLEPGNGCYRLKVNGKSVKPKKISVGERNALGLCYFFAKLFGGKTETDKYSSEYLIIIDDPVSSFDFGNRVGVMSLLRFQFGNIIGGNANSRILVMSHDLQSVFDLVKIRNEILGKKEKAFMELSNNKLEIKRVQNEYKKLLDNVFSYAVFPGPNDPDDTLEISIGNIMRRMLEAFSSFCYDDRFECVLRKKEILESVPQEKRNYYGNFMYRLTLNTESHMEENMYTLNGITTCFSREEKVQTAKSILLFLQYVNKAHISAYLSEEQLNIVDGWKIEEEGWIHSSGV